jgi:hypothetical protein
MSSKPYKLAIPIILPLLTLLLTAVVSQPLRAEIETLFSTPQERKIIDDNRYNSDAVVNVRVTEETDEVEAPQLAQKEVTVTYTVSGITISNSGPHFAWINNEVYEDGQQLQDSSRIKVMSGSKVQIRFTAPDGKIYYANSGETIDITYLAVVEDE